jgi:hypothetical protein
MRVLANGSLEIHVIGLGPGPTMTARRSFGFVEIRAAGRAFYQHFSPKKSFVAKLASSPWFISFAMTRMSDYGQLMQFW